MNRCERDAHELLGLPRARGQHRERRRRHELEMVEDSTPVHAAGTEGALARDDHAFGSLSMPVAAKNEEVVTLPPIISQRAPAEGLERAKGHRSDGGLLEKFPAIHVVSSL